MKNVLCVLVCVSFVILASAKDEVNVDKVLKTVGKNVRKVEPPMPRLPHLMLPPQFKEKLDNAAATASPTGVPTAESKSKLDNALSKMMADEDTKDMSRVVSGPHDLVDALKVLRLFFFLETPY